LSQNDANRAPLNPKEFPMSQAGQPTAQATLFNGPSFNASGIQIVSDADEVSLYVTSTRHAFSANGTQVRPINEVVARLIMTPAAAARIADVLRTYVEQHGKGGPTAST
jgi:hypothetical protein